MNVPPTAQSTLPTAMHQNAGGDFGQDDRELQHAADEDELEGPEPRGLHRVQAVGRVSHRSQQRVRALRSDVEEAGRQRSQPRAPSTSARSFANAMLRVRYFIPQSGAATRRAAGT